MFSQIHLEDPVRLRRGELGGCFYFFIKRGILTAIYAQKV